MYDLVAVSKHIGSLGGGRILSLRSSHLYLILLNQNGHVFFGKGHYVAFSRSSIDGASPNEFDLHVIG